ncbi:MAG: hypothetical protein ACKOAD_04620, partial [Gammaproteobacteria bacterium]
NYEQIKSLLENLDKAPVQLIIYVKRASNQTNQNIIAGTQRQDTGIQKIQVLSGNTAYIDTSLEVPVVTQLAPQVNIQLGSREPSNQSQGYTQEYKKIPSGLVIKPILNANNSVSIQIMPQASQYNSNTGQIKTQALQTSLQIPLGEWLEITGTESSQNQTGLGLSLGTQSRGIEEQAIWIKIER